MRHPSQQHLSTWSIEKHHDQDNHRRTHASLILGFRCILYFHIGGYLPSNWSMICSRVVVHILGICIFLRWRIPIWLWYFWLSLVWIWQFQHPRWLWLRWICRVRHDRLYQYLGWPVYWWLVVMKISSWRCLRSVGPWGVWFSRWRVRLLGVWVIFSYPLLKLINIISIEAMSISFIFCNHTNSSNKSFSNSMFLFSFAGCCCSVEL